MINIKPSTALRTRYNEVAEFCKTTGNPVFLTKNGEGDLVVMDIDTYNEMSAYAHVIPALFKADKERANGIKGIPAEKIFEEMDEIIRRAENGSV